LSESATTTPETFLRSVRRDRKLAFRREIVPHFRYVFQSGFGLFVSAIFFTVLIWYVDFIKAVPDDWTAIGIGAALVGLSAVRAPLRTYLRPADPVFLLALESRMADAYVWPALRGAMLSSVAWTAALFALYSPIYARSPATAPYAESRSLLLLGVLFALLSGLNVFGGWMERKLALQSRRRAFRVARWGLTLLVVAALLFKPMPWAIPFMLLCVIAAAAYRLPAKHGFPWDRLIEEEAANRRRWLAFLSWFVDIPTETAKPAKRRWIAWAGELLPWKRRWAWHYLYAKVFLRGETFGALWRWTLLTCLVVAVSGNALSDAIVFVVSIVVVGLQLSELKKVRFVETADALPIAPEDRPAAAAALARTAGIAAVLLVSAVGLATVTVGVASGAEAAVGYAERLRPEYWLSATAFGLLWCGWWMPSRIARHKDEDDL